MKKKKILTIFFTVVLLFCFLFPASAQTVKLKELFAYDDGTFFTYTMDHDQILNRVDHSWWSDNSLVFKPIEGSYIYGFSAQSPDPSPSDSIWSFDPNDIIVFSSNTTIFRNVDTIYADEVFLKIILGFYNNSGQVEYVTVYSSNPHRAWENTQTCEWDIGFTYEIPYRFRSLASVDFRIILPSDTYVSSDSFFVLQNYGENAKGDMDFYIGPKDGAPLHKLPNTSASDNLASGEKELINSTEGGRNEVNKIFGNAISNGGNLWNGMLAVGNMVSTMFTDFTGVSDIVSFGLALGMFAFVVGMGQLVVTAHNSSVRAERRAAMQKQRSANQNKKGK